MKENIEDNSEDIEVDKDVKDEDIKSNNKKTIWINFILIIVIFVGLLIYMITADGIDNIIAVLQSVDYKWVLLGIICLLINWICEAINLHIPIKKMYKDHEFKNSIKVSMIGLLFNNITPFASGGQPMQAYELTKTGKRVSDSLSAMAIKFIITQTALVITTLIVVIFEFNFFRTLMSNYLWVAILGFGINIIAIILVILAGINKKIITTITNPIVKLLGKIHVLKHPDKTIEKLNNSINNFREKRMVIEMFFISIIQSLAYYSITYMIYRAFGNYGITFWQIIPTQAFLLLIMTFIPTPGSGLGAEGGFYLLFNSIFVKGTINMSILFWRIYTFYLPILVGLIFLIPVRIKNNDKNKC